MRVALRQPGLDRGERVAADRHDARLGALAGDAHRRVAELTPSSASPVSSDSRRPEE